MADIGGGCLCGKVRYKITAEPVASGLCHCRDCQRYTGSSFEAWMVFSADAITLEGLLKTFDMAGTSGSTIHRRFCPNCSSGVINELESVPGKVIVLVGTLDDPDAFKPAVEIYCHTAQPWLTDKVERKKFARSFA